MGKKISWLFIIIVGGDRIKKILFIKQESQSDCGIACLKCILSYYNIYPTSEYLKDTSLYGGTGVTLFGATNFYDNPSTKAEIKVDSSVKSASKFVSGSIEKSALFNSLVDKELAIVVAINSMIEDKGIIPTSINELKTNKYLAINFNPENLISSPLKDITFEVKDLVVEINTNIYYSDSSIGTSNDVTIAERDYYLNNPYNDNNNFKIDKKQFIDSSTNTLKSNYYLNRKSLNILGSKTSNNINHSTSVGTQRI